MCGQKTQLRTCSDDLCLPLFLALDPAMQVGRIIWLGRENGDDLDSKAGSNSEL